jgi:drug/metabolite transporter (DMT)-like permease
MAAPLSHTAFRTGIVLTLAGAILFSTKAIFVKLAFRHAPTIDALSLLTLRMAFALPVYMAVALLYRSASGGMRALTVGERWQVILFGIMGYYMSSLFDFIGLQYLSATIERLILFLYPTFTVLLNAVIFKEKISRVQVMALLLTYAGVALGCIGELKLEEVAGAQFLTGFVFLLLCALFFALYLVGAGRLTQKAGATSFTAYAMLAAGAGVLLHFVLRGKYDLPLDSGTLGYGALLGIVATVIPSFLISRGIKSIGSNKAAIIASIGPVSTIVQAHFILGEPVSWLQIGGTLLVIIGILLISYKKSEIKLAE